MVDKEELLLLRTSTVDHVRDSKDRIQTKGGSPVIAWISLFLEIGSRNKKIKITSGPLMEKAGRAISVDTLRPLGLIFYYFMSDFKMPLYM